MDFENINAKIGGCGLYQYISFMILSITTFKYAIELQGLSFALYEPKFLCVAGNLFSDSHKTSTHIISKDHCKYKLSANDSWMKCTNWIYEKKLMQNTLITELNLVCDRAFYRELMYTTFFIGCLSSYPLTVWSDSIGKRIMLIVCLFSSSAVTLLQILSFSLWQQLTLSFITGAIKSIYVSLAFTTVIEIIPIKYLDIAASNFWILYGVGYMGTALIAYLTHSWRKIYFLSLGTTILYFLYFWFVPESPRWLMLNKKREKAYKTMMFIAKINKTEFQRKDFDNWKPIQEKTGKFMKLLKHKIMIYRFLILNFAAWTFSFAYIGSSTDLTFASDNIFITTFVMGLIELPTGPLAGLFANKFGRKKSVTGLCVLGMVCLVTMPFIESDLSKSSWQPWLKITIAMGAKFGFTSAWLIFDIITNEIMPTTNRNAAMSTVYIAVGIGSIVAPMIHSMANELHYAAPCLMYSVLLLITIILLIFFIPETHNLPIPQTIEQAVSLVINKEQEWKENMIRQAEMLGTVQ